MGLPQGDEGQWFWSSELLTQLVPAPIWGCCLPAPHTLCPLHTHLATSLGPVAFWQSVVDLGQIPHLSAPHMASTSDSLAMRSLSELPSGILGDGAPGLAGLYLPFQVLGAQITAPAPAFPYLLTPPCKAHLPFKESKINQCWGLASPHPQLY